LIALERLSLAVILRWLVDNEETRAPLKRRGFEQEHHDTWRRGTFERS
jgi:hypothetical protein